MILIHRWKRVFWSEAFKNDRFRLVTLVSAISQNRLLEGEMSAAGRLARHLKELRIHLCQTSPGSAGAREFINSNYAALKSANPEFPILIRECSGIQVNCYL